MFFMKDESSDMKVWNTGHIMKYSNNINRFRLRSFAKYSNTAWIKSEDYFPYCELCQIH